MIELPTEKDLKTPHHRKAIGALVAALVVFGFLIVGYCLYQTKEPEVDQTYAAIAARQALMDIPNPTVELTPDQVEERQKLMSTPNPTVELTPEQVEERKRLMGL